MKVRVPTRAVTAGMGALVIAFLAFASAAVAQQRERAITCTNPASGAKWQIKIDYDRKTVDSNPARISDGEITWRDPNDGGNYTLDRKTGALTVIVASSTGGAFFHDRCDLDQ